MGGPAAAGCVVYKEDVEKIVISCMCFISFISYGASYACLGAALPELADSLGVAHAAFGLAFATRGIGFVLGSLVSAKVLEYPKISKENLECFTIATVGLCGVAISLATNYYVILAIFGFQGVFLALVETTANYMLPIIWGLRVQPWMQAMHACFGIGAIAGPFMIGILGLKAAMAIVSVCAFMPAIALGSFKLFGSNSGISNSGEVNCDTNTLHIGNDSSSSLATDAESISTEQSTNDNKESSTHLATPPLQFRIFSLLFFFIYVGIECGYGGWIPTYSLLVGSSTTNSAAAFLTGTFWGAIAAGRIVAIFTSIYLSTTDGLRMQLAISMIGAIFVFFESSNTYHMTAIGSIIFGYGLSSIFPLCYTIANDYGYQM